MFDPECLWETRSAFGKDLVAVVFASLQDQVNFF